MKVLWLYINNNRKSIRKYIGKVREENKMRISVMVSCEDPRVKYICFPDIRLIFRDRRYMGWYLP